MTVKENWNQIPHDVKDLILFADNDRDLEDRSKRPILNNLVKKMEKKDYKKDAARQLWSYHADNAAKAYHSAYGDKNQPWHKAFDSAQRKQAANHWEEKYYDEMKSALESRKGLREDVEFTTVEENKYKKLFEAILDKKPLIISEEFNILVKEACFDLISEKREEVRQKLFERNLSSPVGAGGKTNNVQSDPDQINRVGIPMKKKSADGMKVGAGSKSNAIHATIHPKDNTGIQ